MGEFDQAKYIAEYKKKNTIRIAFNLSLIHDADIIDFLKSKNNKQGYLKELIRADMEKSE